MSGMVNGLSIKLHPPRVLQAYPDVLGRILREFSATEIPSAWELLQYGWYCKGGTRSV